MLTNKISIAQKNESNLKNKSEKYCNGFKLKLIVLVLSSTLGIGGAYASYNTIYGDQAK
ncbi:hypothetical protein [Xenorhabdus bovienii]|uniref:Uncharacterized protein n=1 Tax=Xenorhabdus bovienii TaxID=40576 RepID=A0A0B6X7M5_XENBV|nr:hypothetical protein [Xenorhabdus bovienii]CDM89902.1 exported protein of unknown function [Xenorhabdus bovienii]